MSGETRFGLPEHAVEALNAVFSRYPEIQRTVLYGSRAMGNHRPASDIDLVLVAPKMTLSQRLKIENEIDDLLLPYRVDLSLFHQIDNAELIEHINRLGVEFL